MGTVVQTSYRPQQRFGLVGMPADQMPYASRTGLVETSAGIAFGLAVSQGTGDKGIILGGTKFLGISLRDVTLVPGVSIDPLFSGTPPAVDIYPQYFNAGILTRGRIWVQAGAKVAAGDAAFYNATSGLITITGGTASYGKVAFTANPVDGQTIVIGTTTWTFKASGATGTQTNIKGTLGDTLVQLAADLNATGDAQITPMTYLAYPPSPGGSGQGSGATELHYSNDAVGTSVIVVSTTVTGATVTAMTAGTAAATAIPNANWIDSAIAGELARVNLSIQR